MTTRTTIRTLLLRQDGLITRDQLLARGWSASAVSRRVTTGEWIRVHPTVYRAADHPWTPRARIRALGLWLPDTATLTGRTAAAWTGLVDDFPSKLRVAVPPTVGHAAPPGAAIARRVIAADDRTRVDGLWVTSRALTVLDASVELGLVDGARLMDRALLRKRVTLAALQSALDRTAGRHGTALGRQLLDLAAGGARSEAERIAGNGLHAAGIHGWTANLEIALPGWGPAILDIAFPEIRLAIEVDGWAYHRDVDRFRRDGLRQNEIVVGGWRVLRVTWYELVENLPWFIETVRRAVLLSAA